ncbi:MAG TPA: hypothetical protein VLI55_18240 [Bryobacteraceae bacterium]|nr:hypothetical protein [Bryobacteraceae bacterium]
MLTEANHWLEFVATAIDAALLLRILTLKLHRTYTFITLAATLAVFLDGVMLWLGSDSKEFASVFIYSRFLYGFVFPAAAWDVFEEIKAQVAKLRRLAIFRLISSLILAAIFGFVITGFASVEDENGGAAVGPTLALVIWAASSTASLALLWSMRRAMRMQHIELPRNTFVWLVFLQLSFAAEILACLFTISGPLLSSPIREVLAFVLSLYGIGITVWCVWKLRAIPSDALSTPEKVEL